MTIELLVASLPDRERVVVELWIENTQLAEVSMETERLRVEFYEDSDSNPVPADLGDLMNALNLAKSKLLGPPV